MIARRGCKAAAARRSAAKGLRAIALAACLLAPARGGKAMAQVRLESRELEAEAARLLPLFGQFLDSERRARLAGVRVLASSTLARREGACVHPADLAASTSRTVYLCDGAFAVLRFVVDQWSYIYLLPPSLFMGNARLGNYVNLMAERIQSGRSDPAFDISSLCSVRYFIYLSVNDRPKEHCTRSREDGDGAFVRWLGQNNHLLDSARFDIVEQRHIPALLASLRRDYLNNFTMFMRFAIVHELSHIANDDFRDPSTGRCERYRQDVAADQLALKFLEARGFAAPHEVAIGYVPWFSLDLVVRQIGGGRGLDDPLVAARASTIIDSFAREAAPLAAQLPPGTMRDRLEAIARDPTFGRVVREFQRRNSCREPQTPS